MSTSCSRTFNRWILMRRNLGGRTFYLEEDVGPRWRLEEDHQVLPRNFQWSWLAFNCYTDLRSNRGSKITLNILDSWVSQGCRGETIDWLGEGRSEEVPEGLPEFSMTFGSQPRIWYVPKGQEATPAYLAVRIGNLWRFGDDIHLWTLIESETTWTSSKQIVRIGRRLICLWTLSSAMVEMVASRTRGWFTLANSAMLAVGVSSSDMKERPQSLQTFSEMYLDKRLDKSCCLPSEPAVRWRPEEE